MHIRLDPNELTLDDLEALEGAKLDPNKSAWRQIREVLARFCFVSDEEGADKLEYEEGFEACGKLTLRETNRLIDSIGGMMEAIGKKSLPPEQGDKSSSPSEE